MDNDYLSYIDKDYLLFPLNCLRTSTLKYIVFNFAEFMQNWMTYIKATELNKQAFQYKALYTKIRDFQKIGKTSDKEAYRKIISKLKYATTKCILL